MEYKHVPVMLAEVLIMLDMANRQLVVDCTLGGGGHSQAIASKLPSGARLVGIDQDEDALAAAAARLAGWSNVELRKGNFGNLAGLLSDLPRPDGFLFDLGVSSWQLDNPLRGFAYQHDAPLDMRMDASRPLTAAEIINNWEQGELATIFHRFGEERWAARIARFIARERKLAPIQTTGQLVAIIKAAIPAAARREGGHPARRVFQALRIAVNGELDSLRDGLATALDLCEPGGRIVVISYHSLEDRLVKNMFREAARGCVCPPDLPVCKCGQRPQVTVLTKRPLFPREEEVKANPRSRSARLRAVEVLKH